MKILGWSTVALAAALMTGCLSNPEAADTGIHSDQAVLQPADGTLVSSGSVVCALPDDNQEASSQVEKLLATEEQFSAAMTGNVSFAVRDHNTQLSCVRNCETRFKTASIIKVATVAALLRQLEQDSTRELDPYEADLTAAAIISSDNDAQDEVWQLIGGAQGMQSFLDAAGMTNTVLDADEQWGLTMTTAADQLQLMDMLVTGELLSTQHSDYLLKLMRDVDSEQVWGVSSGAPQGASVALKNGWLDDPAEGESPIIDGGDEVTGGYWQRFGSVDEFGSTWTNNSIGHISSATESYSLVVLSDGNPDDDAGRETVNAVAELVSCALLG